MAKTILPIGPYHPLQEEPEFFTLTVEGERITDIDVRVGYNHRGIEKLSESRTFDQSTFVIERICGCLLYTSDAADDLLCVDLGGRRIIKKKK